MFDWFNDRFYIEENLSFFAIYLWKINSFSASFIEDSIRKDILPAGAIVYEDNTQKL